MMNRGAYWVMFIFLVGCSSGSKSPSFVVETGKPADRVVWSLEDDLVRFNIRSKTGIGNAEIKRVDGPWPETIRIRFHGKGLESLKFSWGDTVVEVNVQSGGDRRVLRSVILEGESQEVEGEDGKFFMPVQIAEEEGWVDVDAPASFLDSESATFRIEWIDFYR